MSDFWPSDIDLSDTQSPLDILHIAQKDWETNSGGILALLLQNAKSKAGHDMIIVHAKHVPSNRTGALFSVIHRANSPYPVAIFPQNDDVPDFLRRTYYQVGNDVGHLLMPFGKTEGKTVNNKWVAETPSEFRSKLRQAFNLGEVKSVMLNLSATTPTRNADTDSGEVPPTEDAERTDAAAGE